MTRQHLITWSLAAALFVAAAAALIAPPPPSFALKGGLLLTGGVLLGALSRSAKVKNVLSVVGIALSLFFGFWAFVYQGYTEDSASTPANSWPYGAVLYGLAVVLIVGLVRRSRPELSWGELAVLGVLLTLLAILAAFGSLDAGGNSFEF